MPAHAANAPRGLPLARFLLVGDAMTDPLATELATTEPLPTTKLSAAQRDALATAIREARASHAALLQQSITNAMEHVPWVLRGALRKVLF